MSENQEMSELKPASWFFVFQFFFKKIHGTNFELFDFKKYLKLKDRAKVPKLY